MANKFRKIRVTLEFVLNYPEPMEGIGDSGIGHSVDINAMVQGALSATNVMDRKKGRPYLMPGSRLRIGVAR